MTYVVWISNVREVDSCRQALRVDDGRDSFAPWVRHSRTIGASGLQSHHRFRRVSNFRIPSATGTDRGGYATLVTTYFKEAVQREMTARGYTYAANNPDLVVNFYSEARDKTEVVPRPGAMLGFGYGYGYGYGRRFGFPRYGWYSAWPFYDNDLDVINYRAGTLKLDVIDTKREQTIWEARVEERLSESAQENPRPNIDRLVTEMFRKYPQTANHSTATGSNPASN